MSDAFPMPGAEPDPRGGVAFRVWAPHARNVDLLLPGERLETRLEPRPRGWFAGHVTGAAVGSDYLYRLDARLERPDPASRSQPRGVHGPSRVIDPDFAWSDAGWRGVARADLVLYELHVGTFSAEGSFDAAIAYLGGLRELGISAIELMPVAQFPGARNWGYDGVFPYAAQSSYGGCEGLRRLVDAAHRVGLAVLLDVVYNHLGPEGNVLGDFGPYFTDRYRTPWGAALNFDGPDSDEVRHYFLGNARFWIREMHLDGLRLDAVHAIHDESARPFLAELAALVARLGDELGRHVHLIAESDANDPRLVRAPQRGGLGLDAVWSDDFHHAVHALLTGERDGYYVDFGSVEQLATAVAERFVYAGGYSVHRRRRHGAPAGDVAADRFVVCVQNHDQVGNRAAGERLSTLVPAGHLRLAAALLLLSPNLPLLFMGEEYGETRPFLYFVDHSVPELIEAVRRGRRAEFAAFAARGEVPDPADPETFARSRLDRGKADPGLRALYAALLRLRREEPALRPGGAALEVDCDRAALWLRVAYRGPQRRDLVALYALGSDETAIPLPGGGPWRLCLDSDAVAFGRAARRGSGCRAAAGAAPVLAAGSARVYRAEAA